MSGWELSPLCTMEGLCLSLQPEVLTSPHCAKEVEVVAVMGAHGGEDINMPLCFVSCVPYDRSGSGWVWV